ncbi:MAG TPA: hypothetical protein VFE35_10685 [Candidatus Cybelea sp.]|jgi:hypothetical protein|nr:hypothetical protein [Candidatus Cybelea sp.]
MQRLLTVVLLVGFACTGPASAMQMTRYLGTPDLPLTAAVVQAGGGAQHFDSLKLLGVLAGPNTNAEVQSLTQRYGKERVAAFVVTFNHAIDDALVAATKAGVTLPDPSPGLAQDGKQLSGQLLEAGTMSDGRFDIGYMLEHLISRQIHVTIMQQLNADPDVGPQRNADFHVILTTVIQDLRTQYGA